MLRYVPCLLALASASALSAQQHHVVPAGYDNQNGDCRELVPGIVASGREQLLIGQSQLTALVGKTLQAIEFRRHKFLEPFPSGSSNVTVTLSIAPMSPLASSQSFAANIGPNPVQVFTGQIQAPTSPTPLPNAQIAWTPDNIVRIAFQTPFLYQGGTLCVDMSGTKVTNQSSAIWTADAASQTADSVVTDLGPGTGPTCNADGDWSSVYESELSAGSHVFMSACGLPYTLCVAMLGHPSPFPIPLNALGIGAPGANCYLDEIYQSQLSVLVPPAAPGCTSAFAHWELWLPNQPWILGAELASQWLELPGWNVSNGIKWTVATSMPALDMAMVVGELAGVAGRRSVNVAHIVRFEYTN